MKTTKLLLTVGLSLGAISATSAQSDAAPRGPRGGHRPPPPLVRALDADRNGVIGAAEIAGASAALRTLDTNADGAVSTEELRPAHPTDAPARGKRPGRPASDNQPHPVPPLMLALDANADGALSAAEITNAAASLAALDANKDGQLTREEIHPVDAPRPAQR